jgi:hypothetical protein
MNRPLRLVLDVSPLSLGSDDPSSKSNWNLNGSDESLSEKEDSLKIAKGVMVAIVASIPFWVAAYVIYRAARG